MHKNFIIIELWHWSSIKFNCEIPVGRHKHVFVQQESTLIVYGGCDAKGLCKNTVYAFEVPKNFSTLILSKSYDEVKDPVPEKPKKVKNLSPHPPPTSSIGSKANSVIRGATTVVEKKKAVIPPLKMYL